MKFVLYSTKCRFYLLGRTKDRQQWRVLKFARDATDPRELEVSEDPVVYSEREVAALLSSVHDGNLQHGGLKIEVQVSFRTLLAATLGPQTYQFARLAEWVD